MGNRFSHVANGKPGGRRGAQVRVQRQAQPAFLTNVRGSPTGLRDRADFAFLSGGKGNCRNDIQDTNSTGGWIAIPGSIRLPLPRICMTATDLYRLKAVHIGAASRLSGSALRWAGGQGVTPCVLNSLTLLPHRDVRRGFGQSCSAARDVQNRLSWPAWEPIVFVI